MRTFRSPDRMKPSDRWGLLLPILATMLAVPAAWAGDISGSYVATGNKMAFLLQVVETGEGQLTGRFEEARLLPNNKIDSLNASVTGSTNGQMVVVTLQPNQLLATPLTVSGTLTGNQLHLSGGDGARHLDLPLAKADEDAFRSAVAALTDESRRVASEHKQAEERRQLEKAIATRAASISELAMQMSAFVRKADVTLPAFGPTETRLRDITYRMNQALARQRSIYGDSRGSMVRIQISTAIVQASVATDLIHVRLQTAYAEFSGTTNKLQPAAEEARLICNGTRNASPTSPASSDQTPLGAACNRFTEASKRFDRTTTALTAAFAEAEDIWTQERQKQDAIVQASNSAT